MWKLRIDTYEGETRWLDLRGPEVTIGRGKSCALCLDERNVSRKHAVLRKADKGWAIADAGSRYGSLVNGRPARGEVLLTPGDLVQIGDYTLALYDQAAIAAGSAPRRPPRAPPRLVVVDEGEGPVTDVALAQAQITIGGREGCTLQASGLALDAAFVRVRALADGRYEARDESARPSLLVNGNALASKVLDEGDLLCVGEIEQTRRDARYGLVLRYVGGPPAPSRPASPPSAETVQRESQPGSGEATPRRAETPGASPTPRPTPAASGVRGGSAPSLAAGVSSARSASSPDATAASSSPPRAPEAVPPAPESVRAGRAPRPSAPEYIPGVVGASVLEQALTQPPAPDAPITGAPMTVDAYFERVSVTASVDDVTPAPPVARPRRRGLWAGAAFAGVGALFGLWASRGAGPAIPPAPAVASVAPRAIDVPEPPAPEPAPKAPAPSQVAAGARSAPAMARAAPSAKAPRPLPARSAAPGQPAAARAARCTALRERLANGEATAYERSLFQTQCP